MERKIIELTTKSADGAVIYTVNELVDGHPELKVKNIFFKRDGLIGINNGAIDEAQYVVAMINEPNKQMFYTSVPERTMHTVSFVEVAEEKNDDVAKVEKVT